MTPALTATLTFGVDPTLDETQSHYRELAHQVATARLAPEYQRGEQRGFVEADLIRELGRLGLIGPEVPEHLGGLGLDCVTTGVITEEIARGDFNVAYLQVVGSLVSQIIAGNARPCIAAEWVPRICSGEQIGGLGLSEPDAGSDAGMPAMRARRERGGYVLNGQKSMSFCMQASAAVIFARTGPPMRGHGISAFLVPLEAPDVGSGAVRRHGRDRGWARSRSLRRRQSSRDPATGSPMMTSSGSRSERQTSKPSSH